MGNYIVSIVSNFILNSEYKRDTTQNKLKELEISETTLFKQDKQSGQ